ncbi:uncharacterized protein LOC121405528 [Drosophila obscura]|uniref:uncharacterized protein LOC121405528 n=1 Tax=Drosophila obscura TaxID=7282 RepID=UPI001BB19E8C|nr:uncharacterized protein LOC121405528 [Drosophila obscura]
MSSERDAKKRLTVPSTRPSPHSKTPSSSVRKDPSGSSKDESKLTPVSITRALGQRLAEVKRMALADFIAASDRLGSFEARLATPSSVVVSTFTLKIRLDEVRTLWEKVRLECERCTKALSETEPDGDAMQSMQAKYEHCYSVYERCATSLQEQIESASAPPPLSTPSAHQGGYSRLPPSEIEVFHGDYLKWPTFRDLFSAIYISNPRLTQVEMLYHLCHKTRGEAKVIVEKAPLTNEGFNSAWTALKERFENKRTLVNSQLRILFSFSPIQNESGAALKELQSAIQGCLTALELSEVPIDNRFADGVLVFLVSSKLPKVTLSLWEQSLPSKSEIPSWSDMNKFLSERYLSLEAMENANASMQALSRPERREKNEKKVNSFEAKVSADLRQSSVKIRTCSLCSKENHPVRQCPRFLKMSAHDRANYIKQQKLCMNCFARGHQIKDCTSQHNCFTCKRRHHTLLHRGNPHPEPSATVPSIPNPIQDIQSASSSNVQSYYTANTQGVLLGTAMINICHLGTSFKARALIDSGSEATFISERLFRIIKLPFQPVQVQVTGLSQAISARPQKICHFQIGSPSKPRIHIETSAYVLPNVAGTLPSYPVPQGGSQPNICGSLLGQETIFGWILTGPVAESTRPSISSFATRVKVSTEQRLENLLTKFWEVEDLPAVRAEESSDSVCEDNFIQTTRRDSSGRYMVSLPFRNPECVDLGHSRSIALTQFLKNEGRLQRNPPLKDQYDSVLQEYVDLGHMRRVPPSNDSDNFYLPHHSVLKPDSTTTKLRVVFNASSPSSNGKSLNDILHPGPVLQSDLTIQILKWRFFQFVFNADITKMYRQITLEPTQTRFQRILFRNKEGELGDYELTTLGTGEEASSTSDVLHSWEASPNGGASRAGQPGNMPGLVPIGLGMAPAPDNIP